MARTKLHTLVGALLLAVFDVGCGSQNNSAPIGARGGTLGSGGAVRDGAGGTGSGMGGAGGQRTDIATGGQSGTGTAVGGTALASQDGASSVGVAGTGGPTNGTYYAITSWSSGWNPNQGAYSTATSITGPWDAQKNIGTTRPTNPSPPASSPWPPISPRLTFSPPTAETVVV